MLANYFDGHSSRRQEVRLSAEAGCLLIHTTEGTRREALAVLEISEPQGRAPRTLRFPDGGYCEVAQGDELNALLARLGHRESLSVRLQGRWTWSLAALLGVVLTLAAAYQWGLPWGARLLAPLVPQNAMQQLSRHTLAALDARLLKASTLAPERQAALNRGFHELIAADPQLQPYRAHLKLHFRSAPPIGPNAFALPDGQIVLFDELVHMPASDGEILAVLAHELGHVRERHGIRQLIQSSVIAAVTAAYLGDLSTLAAGFSSLLLTSGYSRDMEREADDYASATLRQVGRSPADLASALEKLAKAHADQADGNDWLSSHPDTRERISRLGGH